MNIDEKDRYLEARTVELIEADDSLAIENLRAEAESGVLRITGEAATDAERDRVGLLAKSVKGSVTVANDVRVTGSESGADRPADSSNASGAPEGWVENFRDTHSTPHRDAKKNDRP